MPNAVRIMLGCADIVQPGFSQCDAFELRTSAPLLIGYVCVDFEATLPRILSVISIDLGRAKARIISNRGQILYLRSRFLPVDDPRRDRQMLFDTRLKESGIVSSDGLGPNAADLNKMLLAGKNARSSNVG